MQGRRVKAWGPAGVRFLRSGESARAGTSSRSSGVPDNEKIRRRYLKARATGDSPEHRRAEITRGPWKGNTTARRSPHVCRPLWGLEKCNSAAEHGFRSASLHSTRGSRLPSASRAVRQDVHQRDCKTLGPAIDDADAHKTEAHSAGCSQPRHAERHYIFSRQRSIPICAVVLPGICTSTPLKSAIAAA